MSHRVALIIPALDEEEAIAATLDALPRERLGQVMVVDNGSRDHTADVARLRGAQIVFEPRRGYGRACLAGIAALDPGTEIVVFMDGDGSDDPAELERLLTPIERGAADLTIASRSKLASGSGALLPQQRFGNWLATRLLRLLYGARYTDLGPFRAIRREALARLGMRDPNFGWTIEMQIRAYQRGLRVIEVPVASRRRRAGRSKVSGTARGFVAAGAKILWTVFRCRFAK